MDQEKSFELDVACDAGGEPHRHMLRVTSAPAAGIAVFASFEPPAGFRWLTAWPAG